MRGIGFVDLQVNGFMGVDFSSAEVSATELRDACRALLAQGTAAFLPTMVSSPPEVYARNLPMLAHLARSDEFEGRILGIHLEGPFIAPQMAGAHRRQSIVPADLSRLVELYQLAGGCLKMITVAPEIDGGLALVGAARTLGLRVAVGHSQGSDQILEAARDAGATVLTHFGNAVPNQLPRHDNPIVAGFAVDGLSATIIADGHHLSRGFLRAVLRVFGRRSVILVSDGCPLAGQPPGRYHILGQDVVLKPDGRVWNSAEGHLVGSSSTLLQCVNYLLSQGLADVNDCIGMGIDNPLALLDCPMTCLRPLAPVAFNAESGLFQLA